MASTSSYSSTPLRSRIPTSTSNSSLQDDPYSNQDLSQSQTQPLLSNRAASLNSASSGLAKQKGGKHGGVSNTSPSLLPPAEKALLVGIILLAGVVRFWKIGQPSSVVFDEVHFGGFASKYIKQKFFMDVHPPLAKLMIAGTAKLAGFNGDFDFKDISKEYLVGENTPVPYVAIRSMCALLGTLTVPLAYLTLRALSLRATTALVGALLVTFDNALMTQSRHILLDSPLIFFTAFTIYAWVSFGNEEKRAPFSKRWWGWLSLTGLSLGAVASVKWVGLFTISTIGICVVIQLWSHLGDVKQPMSTLGKHFIARSICLIGLPILVYLTCFAIHLGVLGRSGEGDGFMSSEFQHTLRGHGMPNTFADVALGSTITLKHRNTQGGYLHSHLHNYPTGSGQQQITLYPHRDENNEWYVVKAPGPDDPPPPTDDEGVPLPTEGPHEIEKYLHSPIEYLKHGMEIRLIHRKTDKRLHSHETNRPPVTEADYQNEVTGYGFPGFAGDNNDNFMVEIDKGDSGDRESSSRVKALRTTFRLRHTLTGCYLFSHKIALPDWGFGQQEVTCNKNPSRPNSLWYVETNTHPQLDSIGNDGNSKKHKMPQMVNYRRPGFFDKFWELQKVMWVTNAGLTDRHAYDSRPKSWPVLRRGINFWNKDHRQVYLMGNPLIWWGATASIMAYLGARAILMLRAQRGKKDFYDSTVVFYDQTCGFLTLGWALHYLPFHAMNRQLFIHHYLPALYFSILLMSVIFDFMTSTLRPRFRLGAALVVIFISILSFSKFAPLAYAGEWTADQCESARWLKTWDFDCRSFPKNVKDYKESNYPPAIHTAIHNVTSSHIGQDSKVDGAHTSLALNEAPEPGRHAFENAPAKAVQSDGNNQQQQQQVEQEVGPDDGGFEPVHQINVEEAEKLVGGGEKKPSSSTIDPEAVVPEGLDAEQFEAAVLQGTAKADISGKEEKARTQVGKDGKLAPSPNAKPDSKPVVVEEEDDVKIGREN